MMRKHGILPTPTVRGHHGGLHAAIDTTPLPLRHKPASWARGLKRFNGRVS